MKTLIASAAFCTIVASAPIAYAAESSPIRLDVNSNGWVGKDESFAAASAAPRDWRDAHSWGYDRDDGWRGDHDQFGRWDRDDGRGDDWWDHDHDGSHVSAVPEVSTWLLFSLGVAALGLIRTTRRGPMSTTPLA